jgi:polar amino acid transport system substrate-binding protein
VTLTSQPRTWQPGTLQPGTLQPGTLVVASAYPDPPFELTVDGVPTGFDIAMMQAVSAQLGLTLQLVRYTGSDFNHIFDGLGEKKYDAVTSGTTITAGRAEKVLFSNPYLEFNQGAAVNRARTPRVSAEADLRGLTAGIQSGNTSEFVAQRWLKQGLIADIHYYPYDGIGDALDDLRAGKIGVVVKLFPVIEWLVKDDAQLGVAFQVPTHEKLGIAFAKENATLRDAVNTALAALQANGELARLKAQWLPGQWLPGESN